jgi:glycosyltransferase involved in cell wall biosynthesis
LGNELKRIIIIGPVYPYKGGISHYTGLMYRALSKKYDVTMLSFSFQYPGFLYKKEQKDFSNDTFKIEGTRYELNTVNPINWLVTARKINDLRPDLVIIQWWHPYFAPCYQVLAGHIRGRILFICHNVFPHERFPMDKWLTKHTLKKGNFYIVQSGQDEKDLKSVISDAVYKRAVHPTYNAFRMQNISKEKARESLCIPQDDNVLLFFGFVRKYKGLDCLIKAMPEVRGMVENIRLLVVGDFGEDKEDYLSLIKEKKVQDLINIYDGYIPDREVEKFFAACDVVVLPYKSATQSGIVQIAYGFNKPVIATSVGGLPDVVTEGKNGFLVESENQKALADAIVRFYTSGEKEKLVAGVEEENYRFSWDRMVECIENLCSLT